MLERLSDLVTTQYDKHTNGQQSARDVFERTNLDAQDVAIPSNASHANSARSATTACQEQGRRTPGEAHMFDSATGTYQPNIQIEPRAQLWRNGLTTRTDPYAWPRKDLLSTAPPHQTPALRERRGHPRTRSDSVLRDRAHDPIRGTRGTLGRRSRRWIVRPARRLDQLSPRRPATRRGHRRARSRKPAG